MLKLFYITNKPDVARIAQDAGVDRIFVDMEYIGKDERQPNMDTVKNHHTVDDVKNIRRVLDKSELLVRINPIHKNSRQEIDDVVNVGADIIMLPMWKSADDVKRFLDFVNGRVKTILLLETDEARKCLDDVLEIDGIDEVHIGLNDLCLSQKKKFLFELVTDGTVDEISEKLKAKGITFGFGGVGRVGNGELLPAENILAEHYRLGSSMVILSRAFCNSDKVENREEISRIFNEGIAKNRKYEEKLENESQSYFLQKHKETAEIISSIVRGK
ncbi:MAG: aldolase/citrate lyase family protein [Eubacterium sp.]